MWKNWNPSALLVEKQNGAASAGKLKRVGRRRRASGQKRLANKRAVWCHLLWESWEVGGTPAHAPRSGCKSKTATPPAARGTASSSFLQQKGGLSTERPICWALPRVPSTPERCARGTRRCWAAAGGGPRRPAARACAGRGTRPFTYRWNREAPFPSRGRFSRTRGDGKRAKAEAPSGSGAGEPLPEAAAGGRLKRQMWRGASPRGPCHSYEETWGTHSQVRNTETSAENRRGRAGLGADSRSHSQRCGLEPGPRGCT
ncbi:uncharacterized protein LOC123638729 [Lemur catta]|uniref:uncharacterized protein LOC123638729 n=1 Tax=Lemur catta TaxID=9447 RepID=UPI001E26A1E7|nr:uncharacterized protein LOC123638729 [Lemur catta]